MINKEKELPSAIFPKWLHSCSKQGGVEFPVVGDSCPYCKAVNPGLTKQKEQTASKGMKFDSGKIRPALVLGDFAHALQVVSAVGTFGAAKYADSNWLVVDRGLQRYQDAMMRHLLASYAGEECDSESGLSHFAHAAWNLLAVLELDARKEKKNSQ